MTGVDLAAIKARTTRAYDFAQRHEAPPHATLEHVPLSVREHFETDVPALIAYITALEAEWPAVAAQAAGAEATTQVIERALAVDRAWRSGMCGELAAPLQALSVALDVHAGAKPCICRPAHREWDSICQYRPGTEGATR